MLLGFIVSQRGIEPNPEKVSAITRMGLIRDLKGVQRVMGCLASLSRFISRLGEKGLPLYRLLRKSERFSWTPEAQEALDTLKVSLTSAPILTPPVDGEPPTYMWQQRLRSSAQPSLWNDKRRDTLYLSRGRCTASVKYCLKPRHGTYRSKSCFMQ